MAHFAKVYSAALVGLETQLIEIEVQVSRGIPGITIVGLPDKAIEESKERVGAALKALKLPKEILDKTGRKILVNLAPADLKKEGALYDLAMAIGYLKAVDFIKTNLSDKMFFGELSLQGEIRPIKGLLALAGLASTLAFKELFVPRHNGPEASLISGLRVFPASTLKEVLLFLQTNTPPPFLDISRDTIPGIDISRDTIPGKSEGLDISQIGGQGFAKRALEIAAAGSHNVLMTGPPGAGKTLLAKALPSLLPELTFDEALEVTKIYSAAGLLRPGIALINSRPFRSPHHTTSEVALIGGGNPPRPGEITLSHRGVLFLDEFPEFHRDVLESLRQPLEDGVITISRSKQAVTFPAKFMLLAASNPCPCGFKNDPEKKCSCANSQIAKYQRKLSGPLIDRIDLLIEVPSQKFEKIKEIDPEKNSQAVQARVNRARAIMRERYKKQGILTNSELQLSQIKKICQVNNQAESLLRRQVNAGNLSARGYHRMLKIARTIADLEGCHDIKTDHVAEALSYRMRYLEKQG